MLLPMVMFPVVGHHRHLVMIVTEARVCQCHQLAQTHSSDPYANAVAVNTKIK